MRGILELPLDELRNSYSEIHDHDAEFWTEELVCMTVEESAELLDQQDPPTFDHLFALPEVGQVAMECGIYVGLRKAHPGRTNFVYID